MQKDDFDEIKVKIDVVNKVVSKIGQYMSGGVVGEGGVGGVLLLGGEQILEAEYEEAKKQGSVKCLLIFNVYCLFLNIS